MTAVFESLSWRAGLARIKPARVSNQLICLTDLLATCAALFNEKLPPGEARTVVASCRNCSARQETSLCATPWCSIRNWECSLSARDAGN